jgi:hypothetical protein
MGGSQSWSIAGSILIRAVYYIQVMALIETILSPIEDLCYCRYKAYIIQYIVLICSPSDA